MTPGIMILTLSGFTAVGLLAYLFTKSKPLREKKKSTENALVSRIVSYRSRYGRRKDAEKFLNDVLPDNPSPGGTGAVTARLASGDFSGAALVGIASAATKTIVDGGLGFFKKKKIETPKSDGQENLEATIVSLIRTYNELHAAVSRSNRTAMITFFAALIFFFFAAGFYMENSMLNR